MLDVGWELCQGQELGGAPHFSFPWASSIGCLGSLTAWRLSSQHGKPKLPVPFKIGFQSDTASLRHSLGHAVTSQPRLEGMEEETPPLDRGVALANGEGRN